MADKQPESQEQDGGIAAPVASGLAGAYGGALAAAHIGTGKGLDDKLAKTQKDLAKAEGTNTGKLKELLKDKANQTLRGNHESAKSKVGYKSEAYLKSVNSHVKTEISQSGLNGKETADVLLAANEKRVAYLKGLPAGERARDWSLELNEAQGTVLRKEIAENAGLSSLNASAALRRIEEMFEKLTKDALKDGQPGGFDAFSKAHAQNLAKAKLEGVGEATAKMGKARNIAQNVKRATENDRTAITHAEQALKDAAEKWLPKLEAAENPAAVAGKKLIRQLEATRKLAKEETVLSHLSRPLKMVFGESTAGRKMAIVASAVAIGGMAVAGARGLSSHKQPESHARMVDQQRAAQPLSGPSLA